MRNNQGISNIYIIISLILIIGIGTYFGVDFYNKLQNTSNEKSINENYMEFGFVKFKVPSLNQELINKFISNQTQCFWKESDIYNYKINKSDNELEFDFKSSECPPAFIKVTLSILPNELGNNEFLKFEGYKTDFENWELLTIDNKDLNFYENTTGPRAMGKSFFMIENKSNPNSDRIIISITPASDISKNELSELWQYDFAKNIMNNMSLSK